MLLYSLLLLGGLDYDEAYKAAQQNNKPLVVLVSANWCPGCVIMKETVMPTIDKSKMNYTIVNSDKEPELARKIMIGNSIPQLVIYKKTETGEFRLSYRKIGVTTAEEVEKVINK